MSIDLVVAIPILIKDGLEYKYPHRSLQEYFAAEFITTLEPANKQKIYNQNLKELYTNSSDSYFNFWQLCYELDKISFSENFLLFYLDEFIKKINLKSKATIVESLLNFIDLRILLELTYTEKNKDDTFYDYEETRFESEENEIEYTLGMSYVVGRKWSREFDFYKNVFKFLNFSGVHKVIEIEDAQLILNCCKQELQDKINRRIAGFSQIETEDDFVDAEAAMDNPFTFNNADEENEKIIKITVYINKDILNRYEFAKLTLIEPALLDVVKNVNFKKEELLNEMKSEFTFNKDMIESFIKI